MSVKRLVLAIVVVGVLAVAARALYAHLPDRWNPWAELRLDDPPNLLTRYKLQRLSSDADRCRAVLATSDFEFEPVPDRATGPACGFHNAVRIDRTSVAVGKPFSLSCRAAVSLALWERHGLQPAARREFGQPVARIEHFGSYACRNIYGRSDAVRSQHATADAFDVAGFVLADGTRIRVLADWKEQDKRGEFLREARTSACQFFDGVLSPDYNSAHRDHLHLDRGRWRVCR